MTAKARQPAHRSPAPGLAGADRAAVLDSFETVLNRIEATMDTENEHLRRNQPAVLGDLSNRKRQGLLELGRIMRVLSVTGPHPDLTDRLARFRTKVETNRQVLDVHLQAVRGVADIIARTMKDAESDGTYSPMPRRP